MLCHFPPWFVMLCHPLSYTVIPSIRWMSTKFSKATFPLGRCLTAVTAARKTACRSVGYCVPTYQTVSAVERGSCVTEQCLSSYLRKKYVLDHTWFVPKIMKAIESYGSPHWLPKLVLSALVCFLVMLFAGVWFKMQDRKAEQQPMEQAAVDSYSWMWKTTDIKIQAMRLLIWSHLIGCWSILSGAIWAVLKCLRYRRPSKLPADELFQYSRLRAVGYIRSKIGLVGTQFKRLPLSLYSGEIFLLQ